MQENHGKPHSPTYQLMVRVWREELGNDQREWRASVRVVISGEMCYVRTWDQLEMFLDSITSQQAGSKEKLT